MTQLLSIFPPELNFRIPEDSLKFEPEDNPQGQIGNFEIINLTNHAVTWKLKTNRKGRYRFNPILGCLEPRQQCQVLVSLAEKLGPSAFKKADKFRFQGIKEDTKGLDESTVKERWAIFERQRRKEMHILTVDCHLHLHNIPTAKPKPESENTTKANPGSEKNYESNLSGKSASSELIGDGIVQKHTQNVDPDLEQVSKLQRMIANLESELEKKDQEILLQNQTSKRLKEQLKENLANLQQMKQHHDSNNGRKTKDKKPAKSSGFAIQMLLCICMVIIAYYVGTLR